MVVVRALVVALLVATATTAAAVESEAANPGSVPACGPVADGFFRCLALIQTGSDGRIHPSATEVRGYSPQQLRTAYAIPFAPDTTATVAVVAAYANPHAAAYLAHYRTHFHLPPAQLTQVNQRGGSDLPPGSTGWGSEEMLDLEMVSAVCPRCRILYVGADSAAFADLGTAVDTAVRLGATAVSNSYGYRENQRGPTLQRKFYDHPGVAIVASSGDRGYGVEMPAAFRSVVAVGGTRLVLGDDGRRQTETAWSSAGSGCSAFIAKARWQQDRGCANRTVADVSAIADPELGVAMYDPDIGGWLVFGGTSVSSPIVAALYGIAGHVSGYPAQRLYAAPAGALYDVTAGSNGDCSVAYLCRARTGYDGPTGLGTPNGSQPSDGAWNSSPPVVRLPSADTLEG